MEESFVHIPHNIYQIGVILLLFLNFALAWSVFPKLKKDGHVLNLPQQVKTSDRTDTLLAELRVLTEADRVSVLRFHNGTEFLPNNPVWKISACNQASGPGTSFEAVSGEIISNLTSIIGPLIVGEDARWKGASCKTPGMCSECPDGKSCISENRRIVVYDIPSMSGFSREFLAKRGTSVSLMATLNGKSGKVEGMLMLEYKNTVSEGKIKKYLPTVCEYSKKLGFLFNPGV